MEHELLNRRTYEENASRDETVRFRACPSPLLRSGGGWMTRHRGLIIRRLVRRHTLPFARNLCRLECRLGPTFRDARELVGDAGCQGLAGREGLGLGGNAVEVDEPVLPFGFFQRLCDFPSWGRKQVGSSVKRQANVSTALSLSQSLTHSLTHAHARTHDELVTTPPLER